MKIQKVLVLASVFILPTQTSMAGSARDLAQPSANKPAVSAPAKTMNKLKIVAPVREGNVAAQPVASSGPDAVQKPTLPSRDLVIAGQGSNLTVSVRYQRDVCAVDESPLGNDIYDARCDLVITVKNVGDTATSLPANGGFRLDLWYFKHDGEIRETLHYIGNLGVNEAKSVSYRAPRSFKRSTPFTATVDRSRIVTETNENDNRAVFWLN